MKTYQFRNMRHSQLYQLNINMYKTILLAFLT